MAERPENQAAGPPLDLKDPLVAGILAWLIPGLGHLYQGRFAKAALYFVCIMGTFVYGLYLGSSPAIGCGRVVYYSFRPSDLRLQWLCQIGIGLPTVPVTLIQANQVIANHQPPLWNGFMAPPRYDPSEGDKVLSDSYKTAAPHDFYRVLPRLFDMGTVYTMIAGLLNFLVIFDACCGPVPAAPAKKEDQDGKGGAGSEKTENAS